MSWFTPEKSHSSVPTAITGILISSSHEENVLPFRLMLRTWFFFNQYILSHSLVLIMQLFSGASRGAILGYIWEVFIRRSCPGEEWCKFWFEVYLTQIQHWPTQIKLRLCYISRNPQAGSWTEAIRRSIHGWHSWQHWPIWPQVFLGQFFICLEIGEVTSL